MLPAIASAAVISLADPYRGDGGKPVVLAGLLEHLADRLGPEHVHYVLIGGRPPGCSESFPVRLHELPASPALHRVLGMLTRTFTHRAPLQEALLWSPQLARNLDRLLGALSVDLEIYDTNRTGQYANHGRTARRVCYVDDLMSVRYSRMLRAMELHPDVDMQPLGTFAAQVPAPLRPLAATRPAQRGLLALERRLVRRSEDRTAQDFDRSLLVSTDEAERLAERAGVSADRVVAIPPLVDVALPSRIRRPHPTPEYVFLGLLSAPHNEDGLRHVLREVWPQLLRRRPDARLRVIGRGARPGLLEAARRHGDSVTFEGYVDDLDEALSRATAMVNILRFGTGVKIKILEALGRGLPVVSSTVGAEGVQHGEGTGLLVADDAAGQVEALLRLTDPVTNLRASKEASAHFAERYTRKAAFAAYDAALGLEMDYR